MQDCIDGMSPAVGIFLLFVLVPFSVVDSLAVSIGSQNAIGIGQQSFAHFDPCLCSNCAGFRTASEPGSAGYQCRPSSSSGLPDDCAQVGSRDDWVVQTTDVLSYQRFCLYTCKPLLFKQITAQIACGPLGTRMVKAAQTLSGNGRTLTFRSNPMTDPPPLPPILEEDGSRHVHQDPIVQLRRVLELGIPATSGKEASQSKKPKTPQIAKPGCSCRCAQASISAPGATTAVPWPTVPPVAPPRPSPPPPPPLPPLPPPAPLLQQADEATWLPLLPMQMPEFPEAWDYPDFSGTTPPPAIPFTGASPPSIGAHTAFAQMSDPLAGVSLLPLPQTVWSQPPVYLQINRSEGREEIDGCNCRKRCADTDGVTESIEESSILPAPQNLRGNVYR